MNLRTRSWRELFLLSLCQVAGISVKDGWKRCPLKARRPNPRCFSSSQTYWFRPNGVVQCIRQMETSWPVRESSRLMSALWTRCLATPRAREASSVWVWHVYYCFKFIVMCIECFKHQYTVRYLCYICTVLPRHGTKMNKLKALNTDNIVYDK